MDPPSLHTPRKVYDGHYRSRQAETVFRRQNRVYRFIGVRWREVLGLLHIRQKPRRFSACCSVAPFHQSRLLMHFTRSFTRAKFYSSQFTLGLCRTWDMGTVRPDMNVNINSFN